MECRDLTIDDCKGMLDMKGNRLDVLAAVGGRGKEILEDQVAAAAEAQAMPEELRNVIEEMARGKHLTPATLVIQKWLFDTDVSPGHNRLSIPMSQINAGDDFLTDDQKRHLRGSYEVNKKKKKNYIEVRIIEPSLALETVRFCRWDMDKSNGGRTSSSYVINGKWSRIVTRNDLREGMEVQLWCFRVDGDLCFALVRLPQN